VVALLLVSQFLPVLFPEHSSVVVLHQLRQNNPRFVMILHCQREIFPEGFAGHFQLVSLPPGDEAKEVAVCQVVVDREIACECAHHLE
jgi:hypothetical protein